MKKLMIAAAIAFAAVASQAATATWSVNKIQDSPAAAAAAGWLIELYSSSVTYDYAKAVSGDIVAKYTGASVATGSGSSVSYKGSDKGLGDYAPGATEALYMVIYDATTAKDAKNYIISEVVSKTVSDDGGDIVLAYGSMQGSTTANKFLGKSWTATGGDVPEPTSAMLVLLGVAGLALKRRRA